jgi:hypothetical protein
LNIFIKFIKIFFLFYEYKNFIWRFFLCSFFFSFYKY